MVDSSSVSLEAIPDAALVIGRDGTILSVNEHAERLLGFGTGGLVGLTIERLLPERFRKKHPSLRAKYSASPVVGPMGSGREFRALRADGREIPVEIAIGPTGPDKQQTLVLARDLTGTVKLREDLTLNEQRFRIAAESTAELIWEADQSRDSLTWFGDIDGLLGYQSGEFPRTLSGWLESVHPDDREAIEQAVDRAIKTGDYYKPDYRIRCKDGSYRYWEDRGKVTEIVEGQGTKAVGAITDVTDRVQVKHELQLALDSEAKLAELNQTILGSLDSHLAVLNSDGEIIAVNGSWERFARENDPSSLTRVGPGMNYLEACRAIVGDVPEAAKALAGIGSVLAGSRNSFGMEYACHSPSQERWFSMSVTSMETGKGGAVIVHTDVTERVVTRRELARLKDRLQAESEYLQEEIKSEHNFDEIVGNSGVMMATLYKVEQVAATDSTVLLLGETGTGKELLARAVHSRSRRKDRPLIKVDCGTLPAGLIESELFGHEKGAFTGAHDSKVGRFELADGGTIFLDEIGELPVELQSKLLRVLEDRRCQRLGAKQDRPVDVRVIAATNRDLRHEIREGRFRSDLYYRLGVFLIESPPLRERREDIPLLVSFCVSRCSATLGKTIRSVERGSLDRLVAYDWPGNIRELQNVIERSAILCTGETLKVTEPLGSLDSPPGRQQDSSLKRDLHAIERANILRALEDSNWKIKGEGNAASRLGLKPSTLRSRMKRLQLERP